MHPEDWPRTRDAEPPDPCTASAGPELPPPQGLTAMAEAIPSLLAYLDEDRTYRFANQAYRRAMGRGREEILGARVEEIVGSEGYRRIAERLRRALAGEPQGFEVALTLPGAGERCLEARYHPQDTPGGRGVVVVATDVTAQRTLEARVHLKQRQELLGELAGQVAHDFRNLITAILLPCDFLLETAPAFATAELQDIRSACERAADLAGRLVRLARMGKLERTEVDLNEVVRGIEAIGRRIVGADVILQARPAPEEALVMADRAELEQVVLNLLVNAAQALEGTGRVSLGVQTGDGTVEVRVRDTGVGMDEETRARIFEAGFTTRHQDGGSGLGLATVWRVVHDLGGAVEVRSELGQGTEFLVTLPAASPGEVA